MTYQLDFKACTLLEYMQHELFHEYEKAKECICVDNKTLKLQPVKKEFDVHSVESFHPVYLSSLLNQMVVDREMA
jgi:hypothetical protein